MGWEEGMKDMQDIYWGSKSNPSKWVTYGVTIVEFTTKQMKTFNKITSIVTNLNQEQTSCLLDWLRNAITNNVIKE